MKKTDDSPMTPEKVIAERRKQLRDRAEIWDFFRQLALLIIVLFVMFGCVLGITAVGNSDMEPVLSAGDLILYFRLDESFSSGDVLVFDVDGEEYVGRVVAKGGDTIEISDSSKVIVNGATLIESDIFYSTQAYDSDVEYPLLLAEDEYFILCDYRTGAVDSRYFGAVGLDQIKGVLIAAIRREGL